MFKFLSKCLQKFNNYILEPNWSKYRQMIYEKASKKEDFLIGNFSKTGFDYIYDVLIQNTEFQLIFFIKDFDSIFDKGKFLYFKNYILNGHPSIRVKIYTFSGVINELFKDLENQYPQFKYIPLSIKKGQKTNNFIVSDYYKYWLEENFTSLKRNTLDEPFKACCNFHDYKCTGKLLDFIEYIDNQD